MLMFQFILLSVKNCEQVSFVLYYCVVFMNGVWVFLLVWNDIVYCFLVMGEMNVFVSKLYFKINVF